MKIRGLVTFIAIFLVSLSLKANEFTYESLPVQESGRVKPMITVAQETLQLIYGKSKYEGNKPALDILTTWMMAPEPWMNIKLIKIDHLGLKEALGFAKDQKYFSANEIGTHNRLNVLFSDLQVRTARKEKLDPYFQAIQRLEAQLLTFYGVSQGGLHIFPPAKENDESTWKSLRELDPAVSEQFFKIMSSYSKLFLTELGEDKEKVKAELNENILAFTQKAKEVGGDKYPSVKDMQTEVHYQKLKPFFWTWVLYLLSALIFGFSFLLLSGVLSRVASVFFVSAFILHTYGFILRCIITARPPVSNMYETVVWVGWGVVLFAGIFSFLKKKRWIALVGSIVATLCMLIADFAPVILDGTLQPLEPVLRSNLWLTIHVMTITLSYAAFFLAFGVADYGMFLYLKDRIKHKVKIRELAQVCYNLIQVGIVLLAAGTILGGVWADYSWGRFWGWDPKETWAFIALMGYLAVLHARLVGWLKEFGMLASSIVSFSLVIMAWYGVNFVLGAGLHSYGFGAGGIEYVAGFVILHLIYVGYAWFVQNKIEVKS